MKRASLLLGIIVIALVITGITLLVIFIPKTSTNSEEGKTAQAQCSKLSTVSARDECYLETALSDFDSSPCANINNKEKKNECFLRTKIISPE